MGRKRRFEGDKLFEMGRKVFKQQQEGLQNHLTHPRPAYNPSGWQIFRVRVGISFLALNLPSAVCSANFKSLQIAEHIVITDEIVSELKDEIEKVKGQLHHITHHKPDVARNSDKALTQLKSENQRLKKELEQKKRQHMESVREVERAKDIMGDYEQKVGLLHQQALKSSKIMKQSKEKFCRCLKEKEDLIVELQKHTKDLQHCIKEEEFKNRELNKMYQHLQGMCEQNNKKCGMLSENNQKFCECIELLESQLQSSLHESEKYKEEQLANFKCTMCQKLETRVKKQKDKYENRLKEQEKNETILKSQITELTSKLEEMNPNKLQELKNRLVEYDKCVESIIYSFRCKQLEEECQRQCETILRNESRYEKERGDLSQLVDELTTVVKQNKVTLLQLSNINREQEALLETQSVILSDKEQRIKWAESTIEMMKTKSTQLEQEIEDLRMTLSGPCNKEACCCLSRQLEETKTALSIERDNQLMKEKIIEDQSQTICCLQLQIKEKISELGKAREETAIAQVEINKINNDLLKTHSELENELNEKEHLLKKLKKLDCQKIQLTNEMKELEKLLQCYHQSHQCDEKQQNALANLQKQIEQQRHEWEAQKENLYAEKEKAVAAAKFATQKLLDTVADFQSQVNTQRKVQNMLTKMLHEKEEELNKIKSKMISINSITSGAETDITMNEIYKRSTGFDMSNPATSSSFYSFCSNCSRYTMKSGQNNEKPDLKQLFNLLTRTEDEPIKGSK
ncbi:hypothetical protein NQ318_000832 [Aromia moschata]|uniref:Uncharacterized protein n=1 Tax=Aromia moschata TaxID=1265417 RepID=A0AAV8X9T2_9CUCU|nr:hypothetical protein NQ318_000832 [Aromia moschata]